MDLHGVLCDLVSRCVVEINDGDDIKGPIKEKILKPVINYILEQIYILRNADIVIGTHGANLTNIIFSKPGTRVIEISTDFMATNAPHFIWVANTIELCHKFYIDTTEFFENYNRMYNNIRVENPHRLLNMI